MHKKKSLQIFILFFASLSLAPFVVLASEQYVTDELSVYLRRGPGTQYGLTGSLNSGDKVTVLETNTDGKYSRIKDPRGRIAWIETEYLTDTASLKERVPALEQQISSLSEQVDNVDKVKQDLIDDYNEKLQSANQQISRLQASNNELQQQVDEQLAQIEILSNSVDEGRQDLMLKWFTHGGIVAGIGLILGLVLPWLMPRRRKNNRWMN